MVLEIYSYKIYTYQETSVSLHSYTVNYHIVDDKKRQDLISKT